MAFSLQPPPVDADVNELYQWCFRLWEWLQVPERACFSVKLSGDQNNISEGDFILVTFDTEIFDIGSNFDVSTYLFTVPIAGKYLFEASIRLQAVDSAAAYYNLFFDINTSTHHEFGMISSNIFSGDAAYWAIAGAKLLDLNIGDTVGVSVYQEASGAEQTDIEATQSHFSGVLVAR